MGRELEIEWLASALSRAPLALVAGPPGVGKSALVHRTLHDRFPERVPSTLVVSLDAADAPQPLRRILSVIESVTPPGRTRRSRVQRLDSLTCALDLAEAGGWSILLEDIHLAQGPALAAVLERLAAYARASRWIATTRADPALPALAGQVLFVPDLTDDQLLTLSAALAPLSGREDRRQLVSLSAGSPWLLRQHLAWGPGGPSEVAGSLVAGLSADARELLRALSKVRLPIPADDLAPLAGSGAGEALRQLEREGLVFRAPQGLQVPEVIAAVVTAHATQSPCPPSELVGAPGVDDASVRLVRELGQVDGPTRRVLESGDGQPLLEDVIGAQQALLAGELAQATAHALEAVRVSTGLARCEALHLLCDVLLCARRPDELAQAARDLLDASVELQPERFAADAALFGPHDPALLERLAATACAPVTSRRAQALLGGAPTLDRIDRAVLRAITERDGIARVEVIGGVGRGTGPWRPGWGLDEPSLSAWLSEGRRVGLARRPLLWRILQVLAGRGGSGTKEELVREAWGEPAYHPLRHDTKLHVSIRKLRELIEDDRSRPGRIVTTPEGYRLGGVVRRRIQAAPPSD